MIINNSNTQSVHAHACNTYMLYTAWSTCTFQLFKHSCSLFLVAIVQAALDTPSCIVLHCKL